MPALVILPPWWLERAIACACPREACIVAVGVAAVVGLPWYIAMVAAHGRAYLESFFVGDNFERFATSRFNDPRPFWFYLPIVLGGMLPWTPLAAAAAPPLRAWFARREAVLGAHAGAWSLWAGLPLLFFTLSIGKQPRYILPILPPLAMLLAMAIRNRIVVYGDRRDPLVQVPAVFVALLLGMLAALLYRARPLIVMVPSVFVLAAVVAIATAALVPWRLRWRRGRGWCRQPSRSRARSSSAGCNMACRQRDGIPCRTWRRSCPTPDAGRDHRDVSRLRAEPDLLHRDASRPICRPSSTS